jgi:hypothetical protein
MMDDDEPRNAVHHNHKNNKTTTTRVCIMIASYPFLLSVGDEDGVGGPRHNDDEGALAAATPIRRTQKHQFVEWAPPPECMTIPVSKDHLQVWYSDSNVIMITRTSPGSLKRVYADASALFCCED